MRPPARHVLLIVALVVIPSLLALHSRGFFSPDETYYAEVAREMTTAHDPVVPTFDGKPFLEKPPLIYWLLAIAFTLGGWGFASAVGLNTLLTAATALLIYVHVRRDGPSRAALLAAVAYATMLLPTAAGRTALTDPALTLCTTAAIVAFLAGGPRVAALSGAALGLGILAKGPVALLVVGPAIATSVAVRRDRRTLRDAAVVLGTAIVIAAPWHVALAARGQLDAYVAVFLGGQVLSRAVDPWRQQGPWWYYVPVLWATAFPWGTHLLLGARQCWLDLRTNRTRTLTVAAEGAAVVIPFLVFSLARNKFPHYLLPILPWLAAWLGRAGDRLLDPSDHDPLSGRIAPLVGLFSAAGVVTVAVLYAGSRLADLARGPVVTVLIGAALLFFVAGLFEPWRPRSAWVTLAGLALLLHAAVDTVVVPSLSTVLIERPLAAEVKAALEPQAVPIAHRWFRPSFVTYGARGWLETRDSTELGAAMGRLADSGRPGLIVVRSDSEGEVRAASWRRGGEAREVSRVRGLGELNGEILEAAVFVPSPRRDGRRWFFDADGDDVSVHGFAPVEGNRWVPSFRWSVVREARMTVAADPGGDAVLRLQAWGAVRAGRQQRLHVVVNEREVGTLRLGEVPSQHYLHVPALALHNGTQSVTFTVEFLAAPADRDPESDDHRPLGFALDWVALEPQGHTVDLVAR